MLEVKAASLALHSVEDMQSDNVISQDTIDGVPTEQLPPIFLEIATKIENLRIRKGFHTKTTQVNQRDNAPEFVLKMLPQNDRNILERSKREETDLSVVCSTQACVDLLKKYEQWRQDHGYAYYTGVWKVGK